MPRLEDMEQGTVKGLNQFAFSGEKLENLGATEYTLVTVAVDTTGSVSGFEDDLLDSLKAAVESCKKSPRVENLLLRVITFDSIDGVSELHGFKPILDVDPDNDYLPFRPKGGTPLYDAVYSAVGATNEYGKKLYDDDFFANGIVFVITDGENTHSTVTPQMIKNLIPEAVQKEELESLVTVLVGVNTTQCRYSLEQFKDDAGLDSFIETGDVSKSKLAKLAQFVSQSVSSQSVALGTGGPSQAISTTI